MPHTSLALRARELPGIFGVVYYLVVLIVAL